MHVAFVQPREAHIAAHIAAHVQSLSAALTAAGHRATVLDVPAGPPAVARAALREALLACHAETPVDVVEWPDVAGLYGEPLPGVADVLRLHGRGGASQRALGAQRNEGRDQLERSLLRRIGTWLAVSQSVADDARAWFGEHAGAATADVTVLRPIVDVERCVPLQAVAPAPPVICWISDPDAADHGADGALAEQVLRTVQAKEPQATLHRCALSIPSSELTAAIRSAAVVAVPWTWDASGQALLMAQACGVPVVGATRGAAREVVRHGATGLLADPDKPDDIARQLLTLLRNDRLRERMGAAGAAHVRTTFAAACSVHDTVAVYERAIAAARASFPLRAIPASPHSTGLAFAASHSRTGYGVVGSHLLRALQQRGVPVHFHPIGPVDRTIIHNSALDQALTTPPTLSSYAPSVRLSQQFDLETHVGDGPRVAFTIFERDRFTSEERAQLAAQDAILVCTEWAREVCRQNDITRPIHVVPLGVDRAVFHERVMPMASPPWDTTAGETVFMQVGKLEPRKGQFELLCAFEEAFTPDDPVRLVLHAHNPFIDQGTFETLAAPFRASPLRDRITLISSALPTAHDVAALMAHAHCGVFAVRAEGWNLEALEMLSMGTQIIATHVTAHTDFLDADSARLITIDRLEPALQGTLPGAWAAWDVPQHQQLVAHLRAVHAERMTGTLARNDAGIRTATALSWEYAAGALLAALDTVHH